MKTPLEIEIQIGQLWQEVDPRFERIVRVCGLIPDIQRVQVRTVFGDQATGRLTNNKLSRFNGKRSGYKPVVIQEKSA